MSRAPNIERQALSQYLREISVFPLLEQEDERRLVQQVRGGDRKAAASLVESNLSFVVKIAAEYRSLGVPFEDLLNEGNLGLIEATKRYDPDKGTKFITYAIWWIRKAILKTLADHALVVRVPSYRRKKIYELKKAEAALRNQLKRMPTREEVARHLSASIAYVERIRRLHLEETSLDRKVGDENTTSFLDFLADEGVSAEDRLLNKEAMLLVAQAFRKLSPREQAVLGWRLALEEPSSLTLQQIADRLEISRERVRQIESGAKYRLRRLFAASLLKSSAAGKPYSAHLNGVNARLP